MRGPRIRVVVVLLAIALAASGPIRTSAQSLNSGLFTRYVDALRQEYGIPGMSVVVLHNGVEVMSGGFGSADLSQSIAARVDTPYPVLNLTETIGAAALLRQCVDGGRAELSDPVVRWTAFPDSSLTLNQALGHATAEGGYKYDSARYEVLGEVTAECAREEYAPLVGAFLELLAMTRSVPGREAVDASSDSLFSEGDVARYRSISQQMAVGYRIGTSGPSRTEYALRSLTAATGLVSTAHDLAQFDTALDRGLVLSSDLLVRSWTRGSGRPTGLGWFVQDYNGRKDALVWHFGVARDAYSTLFLKVPERRLTLIMLANSDRLSTGLSTTQPDVTQSVFAKTFLRLFVD